MWMVRPAVGLSADTVIIITPTLPVNCPIQGTIGWTQRAIHPALSFDGDGEDMEEGEYAEKQYLPGTGMLACLAVAALFVTALHASPGLLADFLDQERRLARWTGFWHGTIPQRIFTRRVPAAGKE